MRTPPDSTIPHQSIENREQLPHARHQSHLLRFAGGKEPLVELLDGGIVAASDQSSHVEGRPHRSPATPHLPLAAALPGITVEGSDPHQGTKALVGELAQFGQLGEQSARKHRTDAGNTPEKGLVLLEGDAPLDGFIEIAVGAGEFFLEPSHVCSDALLERLGSHLETVVLGDEHREDLSSPGEYVLQELGFLVRDYARCGLDCGGEAGEDEGINSVGLGKATDGLGELVPSLAGIDHGHGDSASGDGGGGQALISSGGFQDDQRWSDPFEPGEQLIDTLLVVGEEARIGPRATSRRRGASWRHRCPHGPLVVWWDSLCGFSLPFM